MNFSYVRSLQRMAATRIVSLLWNGADVRALIAECDGYYGFKEIEKKVNEKVSLLSLPVPLREKLSTAVVPIGDQIWRWKWKHVREFDFKNIPKEFRWTARGTVDQKGTAEAFVRDPTLPERERYNMACLYCIEWDDPVPFHGTESYPLSEFVGYWTYERTGDATALDRVVATGPSKTPCQGAFDNAVGSRHAVAAEYYLGKMSPGEREQSLSDLALWDLGCQDFEFYCFLLLHMNERQRSEMLEEIPYPFLSSLLEWPWSQFFVVVARRVRYHLKCHEYSFLLRQIVDKIVEGNEDFSYGGLFGQFWAQVPPDLKEDIIGDSYLMRHLFRQLLRAGDDKNVSLLLKDAEETLSGERSVRV